MQWYDIPSFGYLQPSVGQESRTDAEDQDQTAWRGIADTSRQRLATYIFQLASGELGEAYASVSAS